MIMIDHGGAAIAIDKITSRSLDDGLIRASVLYLDCAFERNVLPI